VEFVILLIVVAVAVFLSVVATWMVRRSVALTGFQKVAQIVLAWVIPFLGAIAVISILTDPKDRERRRAKRGANEESAIGGDSDLIRYSDRGSHSHSGHDAFDGGGDGGHGGDGGGH
jgi:uncharacterized membrane protein YgcG